LNPAAALSSIELIRIIDEIIVTPQNRHLADYSDQATIYMMSLWKRTTKRLVHVQHARDAGGIKVATVTQVHDGTHKRI
jgi:hypothetical protein